MPETIDELRKEIQATFDAAGDDIRLVHEQLRPAVIKLEEFFRKSNNIEALEDQVQILELMGDNRFRSIYLMDQYVVCKRILDIDSTKEEAKHQIEHHIIPYLARNHDEKETIAHLEKKYKEMKQNNYDYFLGNS